MDDSVIRDILADKPCSYLVKNARGCICRNRRHSHKLPQSNNTIARYDELICLKVILNYLHLKVLETLPNNSIAETLSLIRIISVYLPLVQLFGHPSDLTIKND